MTTEARRAAKLAKALSGGDALDALSKVRELIPDDGPGAQQVVVYGFAGILEVSSVGLSVLFERFEDDELQKFRAALEAIGATETLADFRTLEGMFVEGVAAGRPRLDAADWVAAQPDARRIDRRTEVHAEELKEALLTYCKSHVDELATSN